LPSIYDYAGACNAINPILFEEFLTTIAIAPPLPVSEEYKTFFIENSHKISPTLWDETKNLVFSIPTFRSGPSSNKMNPWKRRC
jgi:hypothetical protein